MPPFDDLVTRFHFLSKAEQKAFLKTISQRGPAALARAQVHQAVKDVLKSLFPTIDGMPLDQWLMNMPLKELDTLPLDAWKRTTKGYAVFKRKGQKRFETWATNQTKRLKDWKGLQMKRLLELVEARMGTITRKNTNIPKGGTFRPYVQEAIDEFLMGWSATWQEIPPALRTKHQPGIRSDISTFYDRQHEYLNSGIDVEIRPPSKKEVKR